MAKFITELYSRFKEFFTEKINLVIFLLGLIVFLILYVYVEILDSNYHFYMNTKTSLEVIHNNLLERDKSEDEEKITHFDTYDGNIVKERNTEEKIIRKNNRKFHLYYLLKKIGF